MSFEVNPEVRDLLLGKEPDDLDLTLCLRDCPEKALLSTKAKSSFLHPLGQPSQVTVAALLDEMKEYVESRWPPQVRSSWAAGFLKYVSRCERSSSLERPEFGLTEFKNAWSWQCAKNRLDSNHRLHRISSPNVRSLIALLHPTVLRTIQLAKLNLKGYRERGCQKRSLIWMVWHNLFWPKLTQMESWSKTTRRTLVWCLWGNDSVQRIQRQTTWHIQGKGSAVVDHPACKWTSRGSIFWWNV